MPTFFSAGRFNAVGDAKGWNSFEFGKKNMKSCLMLRSMCACAHVLVFECNTRFGIEYVVNHVNANVNCQAVCACVCGSLCVHVWEHICVAEKLFHLFRFRLVDFGYISSTVHSGDVL